MNKNGQRIMSLETRSRMSRLKLNDRDTIEKENIRRRIKRLGGEDQKAKDLIYNCAPNSDLFISECDRFNRNFEDEYRRQRQDTAQRKEAKRELKTIERLRRREKLWKDAQLEDDLFRRKVEIKRQRVHDNPLVNNLGFDLLNLEYKPTKQGRLTRGLS